MLVFPQLVTGASGPYPLTKTVAQRAVVNTLGDGRTDVFADPDAAALGWELNAKGITQAEWIAIETLFLATSGMWQTFTFLDPAGNLLAQSEDLGATVWTNSPLMILTTGIDDPLGTSRATRVINAGEATGSVAQTLAVPGNFQYCFSVWARTVGGSNVTLFLAAPGPILSRTVILTSDWARISISGNPGQTTTSVTFGVQLDSGASVDLFGMQVEAQLAPSDYKETGVSGGVYPKARFASDQLTVTAQGTDVYDAVIRIVNTET